MMYRDLTGESADFRRGYAEGWCHGKLTEWENHRKTADLAQEKGEQNDTLRNDEGDAGHLLGSV